MTNLLRLQLARGLTLASKPVAAPPWLAFMTFAGKVSGANLEFEKGRLLQRKYPTAREPPFEFKNGILNPDYTAFGPKVPPSMRARNCVTDFGHVSASK